MLAALVGGWPVFIRIFSLSRDTTSAFHLTVNFARSNSLRCTFVQCILVVEIFSRRYSNFTASNAMALWNWISANYINFSNILLPFLYYLFFKMYLLRKRERVERKRDRRT